jgi:hypothetical protein
LQPASSSIMRTFSKTEWHWASISWEIIFPTLSVTTPGIFVEFGFLGPTPERKSKFHTFRA